MHYAWSEAKSTKPYSDNKIIFINWTTTNIFTRGKNQKIKTKSTKNPIT